MNDIPEGYELVSDIPEGYELVDQPAHEAQPAVKEKPQEKKSVKDIYNGFKFGTMVENIPSSAAGVFDDVVNTASDPLGAIQSTGNLGAGLISKLFEMGADTEETVDAVGGFITGRYGSEDNFKKTLMQDPVGVLSDFAAVLSGGGALVPKVGGKIAKIGTMIDPVNMATAGTAKAISNAPIIKDLPANLYESAAKFSTTLPPNERRNLTQTALDNKILPSSAGIQKSQDIINGYNDKIESLIAQSTESGQTISKEFLFRGLKDLRDELGGVSIEAPKDIKKINEITNIYSRHLKKIGKDNLTASDLQKIKQDIYKNINYKKKKMKGSRAKEMAYKSIARSAKEQIEMIYPEIKGLNAKEGEMLALMDEIKRSAARIENRDIMGIGIPLKVGAGSVAGGGSGAVLGLATAILDTPTVKSRLAIALQRAKEINVLSPKRVIALESARLAGKIPQDEELK